MHAVERVLCFLKAHTIHELGQGWTPAMQQQHTSQLEWLDTFMHSPIVTRAIRVQPSPQELREQGDWVEPDVVGASALPTPCW